jgi:hypothetical protein
MLQPQPILVIRSAEVQLNNGSGDTNRVGGQFNSGTITCLVPVYLQYNPLQASILLSGCPYNELAQGH